MKGLTGLSNDELSRAMSASTRSRARKRQRRDLAKILCETDPDSNPGPETSTPIAPDVSLSDATQECDRSSQNDDIDARDFLVRHLLTLAPREERIIRLRFGLGGLGEHTLREIANDMNCTPSSVQRLEQRALRKLRYQARRVFPRGTAAKKRIDAPKAQEPVQRPKKKRKPRPPVWQTSTKHGRSQHYHPPQTMPPQRIPISIMLKAFALGLVSVACLFIFGRTIGSEGATYFADKFGRSHGPLIRLAAWLTSELFGPVAGFSAAYFIDDWRYCMRRFH